MKNSLQFVFIIGTMLIGSFGFAQTATATLNVQLNDIQSIEVNSTQTTVNVVLDDIADYTGGTSVDQADHLKVVSTSDYSISVKASQDLTNTVASETIPVSNVELTASAGTGASATGITYETIPLTISGSDLITGVAADLDGNYNVNYAVTGGNDFLNKSTGTYTTTITYTLTPQ